MEFHSKLLQPLPEQTEGTERKSLSFNERGWNRPLPFYMTYPDYYGPKREAELLRDLEYLQQVYPNEVRRYQKRIGEILDKADYEGSMIYDEYPDRCSLQAMARTMTKILEKEEEKAPGEDMIQVLLCNEIYKRRHGGRRGNIIF